MEYKSYRNSHISKNRGKRYDLFYNNDYYDSRLWILEKEILEDIFQNYIKNNIKYYLDFACGTGRILEVFEKKSIFSFGVDISKEMLKEGIKKFKKTTFLRIDITKNQLVFNKKFDVITAFRFFLRSEVSLRKNALLVINMLLKKNGIFIFNIHANRNGIMYFFKKNKNTTTLSLLEMSNLLKKYNFEIKKVYGLSFLPYIFSIYMSRKMWLFIERFLINLKLFTRLGGDLIILCQKI